MRPSLRQVLFRSAGLDLNFAGGVFSLNNTRTASPANIPGWSYTRTDTNGTATALDLAGNVIQFPSRTNRVLQSQGIGGSPWSAVSSSVVSTTITAPDGSSTATQLSSTGAGRFQGSLAATSGVTDTASGFMRWVSGPTTLQFNAANNLAFGGIGLDRNILFNGSTGAFISKSAEITSYTITALADGWFRITATFTPTSTTAFSAVAFYAASGTVFDAWGAQLETGSTATAYIPTTTAAVTVVLPRITNRGILVEEARTNGIRNSAAAGAVAGTPGTAPTNWSVSAGTTSLSTQVVATGTDATTGATFVEIRFFGTTTTGGTLQIRLEAGNSIAATNAQAWSASVYAALVAGSVSGFTAVPFLQFDMNNAAGGYLGNSTNTALTTTSTMTRSVVSFTTNQVLTAFVFPYIAITPGTGKTVDFTLRVSIPQMELGAFATSPIITTGAAGTRGADAVTMGSFVFPAAYTCVVETQAPVLQTGLFPTSFSSTGTNVGLLVTGSTNVSGANMGNATFNDVYGSAVSAGGTIKNAFRAETNNARGCLNGTLSALDATFTPVVGSQTLNIGAANGSTSYWNSYVQRIRILPTALPNAQLQALTAP